MDNMKAKLLNKEFLLLAVLAVCLLCPFCVRKAAAAETVRVIAYTDSSSESNPALLGSDKARKLNQWVNVLSKRSEETLELMGYPSENTLIGLFSVEDWYKEIQIPVTSNYVAPKVQEFMNVREEASTDSEIIGKLRKGSYAKIVERLDGWTKIESGKVTGYVNNEYLYMDEEALDYFAENDAFQVVIKAGSMNVRSKPNTDCKIIGQALNAEVYTWYPDKSVEGWFAIQYDEETIAYVSSDYCDSKTNLATALTMEEEEARLRAEAYAKALEHSKKSKPPTVNREPMEFTDEELYLMSVVIAMEALNESYEGKVAVANVIINRILDGYWGTTLHEVIYAPGQFSGANSGRIEQFWNQADEECRKAAVHAAAGYNNIDDYLFFISLRKADYSKYYKYYVLGGHCFYARHW